MYIYMFILQLKYKNKIRAERVHELPEESYIALYSFFFFV